MSEKKIKELEKTIADRDRKIENMRIIISNGKQREGHLEAALKLANEKLTMSETNKGADTSAEEKIKPCPFCGTNPIWVNAAHPSGKPGIKCPECQYMICHDRVDKTVGYWNRRHETTSLKAELEAKNKSIMILECGLQAHAEILFKVQSQSKALADALEKADRIVKDYSFQYGEEGDQISNEVSTVLSSYKESMKPKEDGPQNIS